MSLLSIDNAFTEIFSNDLSITDLFTNIRSHDISGIDVQAFITLVAFDGFSAEAVHKEVMACAFKAKRSAAADIIKMIIIVIIRGTMVSKMEVRSSVDAAKEIDALKKIYHLVDNVRSNANKRRTCITLGRICSVYAPVAATLVHAYPDIETALNHKEMKNLIPDFPKVLLTPGFAALIPPSVYFHTSKKHEILMNAVMLLQILFTRLVTKKQNPTDSVDEVKVRVQRIVDAAHKCSFEASKYLGTIMKVLPWP